MEKQSLTQGQGHKENQCCDELRHTGNGEDFNADVGSVEYSYTMGVGVQRQRGHTGGKH